MFKSLLNAGNVAIDSLILDIFIILGVVVAGALIVYFIWEAVSSVTNKSKNKSSIKEPDLGAKKENTMVESYSLETTVVKEEKKETVATPVVFEETKVEEVSETKAEEEKAQSQEEIDAEERANAERRAYLEARRQELIKRMQAEMQEEQEETTEEETASEEETVEEPETDKLEEERNALLSEKARYETMVRELEAAKRALEEQAKAQQTNVVTETRYETVVTNGVLSLEELKAKLAEAEERLRVTEKEFKQCKKEYSPLHRVWKTHEKDEKKLRRKEALVAKQKVILYGVNNYADIDEEKAKKLAEDLDLLDGLKLSVQHCEEVMKKNEERYPYLEKMYNVLLQRNEELKNDIAYYKEEIAKLEAEENETNE